ncbi:hypothetical protein IWZ01DRAFT_524549 [Phyllosticta capitalensis]
MATDAESGSFTFRSSLSVPAALQPWHGEPRHGLHRIMLVKRHFQPGLPLLADFLCKPENMIFRRFRYLRMRMLLRIQSKITSLEDELDSLDRSDLANNRDALRSQKGNNDPERERIFSSLQSALAEYDSEFQRAQWMLTAPEPSPKQIHDVRTKVQSSLVGDEGDYVNYDVVHIRSGTDPKFGKLFKLSEDWTLRAVARIRGPKIRQYLGIMDTQDGQSVTPLAFIHMVTRTVAALLSVVVLLVPMIILNFVNASGWRLAIVSIFATIFIAALTALSAAGTMEIFVAGATYCAVLVVFVSQGGASGSG